MKELKQILLRLWKAKDFGPWHSPSMKLNKDGSRITMEIGFRPGNEYPFTCTLTSPTQIVFISRSILALGEDNNLFKKRDYQKWDTFHRSCIEALSEPFEENDGEEPLTACMQILSNVPESPEDQILVFLEFLKKNVELPDEEIAFPPDGPIVVQLVEAPLEKHSTRPRLFFGMCGDQVHAHISAIGVGADVFNKFYNQKLFTKASAYEHIHSMFLELSLLDKCPYEDEDFDEVYKCIDASPLPKGETRAGTRIVN